MSISSRLIDVVLPEGGYLAVLYEGYFDESGELDDKLGVFGISGYIFEAEAAKIADKEWGDILNEYRLEYFHMVDCAHGAGIFKDDLISPFNRIEVEKKLIDVIKRHSIVGISVLARSDLYKSEGVGNLDPYSLCAYLSMNVIKPFVSEVIGDNSDFAYFFESGHKNQNSSYNLAAKFLERSGASMTFAAKKKMRLLQAADLLAWQSVKWAKDETRPTRKDFESLLQHPHDIFKIGFSTKGLTIVQACFPQSRRPPNTITSISMPKS